MSNLIINQSRLTARTVHNRVLLDLLDKGWIAIDAAEEQPVDVIIDMGLSSESESRIFNTIQIKSWKSLKTSSRPAGENEFVSVGGKARNNYWYYDQYIDWIATVNSDDVVVYWPREIYQKKTSTQLKGTTPVDFPKNKNTFSYAHPTLNKKPENSILYNHLTVAG